MNKARMWEVAAYAQMHGVTKAAKKLLCIEGNKTHDYSFKGDLKACRRAVRKAVKWVNSNH